MQYNFEWDPEKAKINRQKHKVNFEQAATAFKDSQALSIYDNAQSENEDRWITMGLDSHGVLLVIHHTYKQVNEDIVIIRIISSRKATRHERKQYEEK